jgi:F0F1-type ATP synthase assembly protein I
MDEPNKLHLALAILGKVAIVGSGVMVGAVLGWILALLTGLINICG